MNVSENSSNINKEKLNNYTKDEKSNKTPDLLPEKTPKYNITIFKQRLNFFEQSLLNNSENKEVLSKKITSHPVPPASSEPTIEKKEEEVESSDHAKLLASQEFSKQLQEAVDKRNLKLIDKEYGRATANPGQNQEKMYFQMTTVVQSFNPVTKLTVPLYVRKENLEEVFQSVQNVKEFLSITPSQLPILSQEKLDEIQYPVQYDKSSVITSLRVLAANVEIQLIIHKLHAKGYTHLKEEDLVKILHLLMRNKGLNQAITREQQEQQKDANRKPFYENKHLATLIALLAKDTEINEAIRGETGRTDRYIDPAILIDILALNFTTSDSHINQVIQDLNRQEGEYIKETELSKILAPIGITDLKGLNQIAYVSLIEFMVCHQEDPTLYQLAKVAQEVIGQKYDQYAFKLGLQNIRESLMKQLAACLGEGISHFILPKIEVKFKDAQFDRVKEVEGLASKWIKDEQQFEPEGKESSWAHWAVLQQQAAERGFNLEDSQSIEQRIQKLKEYQSVLLHYINTVKLINKNLNQSNRLTTNLLDKFDEEQPALHLKSKIQELETLLSESKTDLIQEQQLQKTILESLGESTTISINQIALFSMLVGNADSHLGQYKLVNDQFYNLDFSQFLAPGIVREEKGALFPFLKEVFLDHPVTHQPIPDTIIAEIKGWDTEKIKSALQERSLVGDRDFFAKAKENLCHLNHDIHSIHQALIVLKLAPPDQRSIYKNHLHAVVKAYYQKFGIPAAMVEDRLQQIYSLIFPGEDLTASLENDLEEGVLDAVDKQWIENEEVSEEVTPIENSEINKCCDSLRFMVASGSVLKECYQKIHPIAFEQFMKRIESLQAYLTETETPTVKGAFAHLYPHFISFVDYLSHIQTDPYYHLGTTMQKNEQGKIKEGDPVISIPRSLNSLIEDVKVEIQNKEKEIEQLRSEIENRKKKQLKAQNKVDFLIKLREKKPLNKLQLHTLSLRTEELKAISLEIPIKDNEITILEKQINLLKEHKIKMMQDFNELKKESSNQYDVLLAIYLNDFLEF